MARSSQVLVLHPAGGLHLDQPPAVATRSDQDVGPDDDIVEGDEPLVEDGDRRIGQERRRAGEPLLHLEVLHIHENAARIPLPGEFPDPRSGVEDRLRALVEGRRQLPGMNLQVEPLGALEAGQVPGLGEAGRHRCRSAHKVCSPRLLKTVRIQGGARCEVRGVLSPYVAAPRERANAVDGPFSAAC